MLMPRRELFLKMTNLAPKISLMMNSVDLGSVEYRVESDGIGVIEFFHPMSNSLPARLLKQLTETIYLLDQNNEVRVIVLQSSGDRGLFRMPKPLIAIPLH